MVAPHVGGFPEVVEHGKTGWLVNNRNADEFVQIINDVISNNGAIATAGENARERAQKYFSIECMIESCMKMYLRVRAKISLHFRRMDLGHLCSIRCFKTTGIASYFEDFGVEDRAKMA